MTVAYTYLNKQIGKSSETENWKFICHAVRAIFNALYKCRRGGAHYVDESRKQVWFVLKTVPLQQKIFEASFYNHKIVQRVLYQHLKTYVVLCSVYDNAMKKTNEKITIMEKIITKLQNKVKGWEELERVNNNEIVEEGAPYTARRKSATETLSLDAVEASKDVWWEQWLWC